jgi:hypothetical protein
MMSRVCFSPFALSHLEEADTLPHVIVLVHPLPPLGVVEGEDGFRPLIPGQARQELLGRVPHGGGGDAGRAHRKEPGYDLAASGNSFVRRSEPARLGVAGHLLETGAPLFVGLDGLAERDAGEERRAGGGKGKSGHARILAKPHGE